MKNTNNYNDEDISNIYNYIKQAVAKTYRDDSFLFNIDSIKENMKENQKHVGERAITFRIAHYLANKLNKGYKELDVDVEYNRHSNSIKKFVNLLREYIQILSFIKEEQTKII